MVNRPPTAAARLARETGAAAESAPTAPVQGLTVQTTEISIAAADRPGLLRDVGRALAHSGIAVGRAHIETYAGRCRDVFYLTDAHTGRPLDPPGVARAVGTMIDAMA